ncbi:hypothetical protein HK097_008938, partial [Rhizophlyctis rosea]
MPYPKTSLLSRLNPFAKRLPPPSPPPPPSSHQPPHLPPNPPPASSPPPANASPNDPTHPPQQQQQQPSFPYTLLPPLLSQPLQKATTLTSDILKQSTPHIQSLTTKSLSTIKEYSPVVTDAVKTGVGTVVESGKGLLKSTSAFFPTGSNAPPPSSSPPPPEGTASTPHKFTPPPPHQQSSPYTSLLSRYTPFLSSRFFSSHHQSSSHSPFPNFRKPFRAIVIVLLTAVFLYGLGSAIPHAVTRYLLLRSRDEVDRRLRELEGRDSLSSSGRSGGAGSKG